MIEVMVKIFNTIFLNVYSLWSQYEGINYHYWNACSQYCIVETTNILLVLIEILNSWPILNWILRDPYFPALVINDIQLCKRPRTVRNCLHLALTRSIFPCSNVVWFWRGALLPTEFDLDLPLSLDYEKVLNGLKAEHITFTTWTPILYRHKCMYLTRLTAPIPVFYSEVPESILLWWIV